MTSARLAIVNFSPVVKRLFWWQPEVYALLNALTLLALVRPVVGYLRCAVGIVILAWVGGRIGVDRVVLYLPIVLVWVFAGRLGYREVSAAFWKLRFIFVASVAYGLFQKAFGYLSFEISWIHSGLGVVIEEGYFVTEDLRAFSFYAGVPEFAFFSGVFAYLALEKRSWLTFLIAVLGVLIAGSRGVLVSLVLGGSAVAWMRWRGTSSRIAVMSVAFLAAVVVYLLLAVVLPLALGQLESETESRLLVYGTFNARVLTLLAFLANVTPTNVVYGVGLDELFDNFYLTLLNDFGLIGLALYMIFFMRSPTTMAGAFICVTTLSYNLYADTLFSVYYTYTAFLLLRAREPVDDRSV